jgi:hypothetical protein
MRSFSGIDVIALLATLVVGACDTPTIPEEEAHPAPRFTMAGGMEGLNQTIAGLESMAADPWTSLHSSFGGSQGASSLQDVLSDLRAARTRMTGDGGGSEPGEPITYAFYNPSVSGASWITPTGSPGSLRNAKYQAYTTAIDCTSMDVPRGQMVIRQYAGSALLLSAERTFSGYQGYALGEFITTISGPAQTGYLSTHHWVEVWLGPDPHHDSQASGQV